MKTILGVLLLSLAAFAQTTTLSVAVSATDLNLQLASVSGVKPNSLILVEDEAMTVCSVNAIKKTVRICSWGRASEGTTAATHAQGVSVVLHPVVKKDRTGNIPALPGAGWTKYTCDVSSNAGFWTCNGVKGAALAADTTQQVAVVTLPARTVVHGLFVKHSVPFAGTSITQAHAQVGIAGTAGAFMTSTSDTLDVFATASSSALYVSSGGSKVVDAVSTPVVLTMVLVGANNSALTAGTVEVSLLTSVLP